MPPIQIIWRTYQNVLEVYDYHDVQETNRLSLEPLETRYETNANDFLSMIDRFKNLKAFL
jgi:hypothetical protein